MLLAVSVNKYLNRDFNCKHQQWQELCNATAYNGEDLIAVYFILDVTINARLFTMKVLKIQC